MPDPTMLTSPLRPVSTPASAGRREWFALAFIAIAMLMVVLDGTIVNVALPAAQADLGFGDANRQWVVTSYALAFGSVLLLGGRLIDLFGQKHAFLLGLAGFGIASALGGFAPSLPLLVIARVAQGLFAALLAPAALSLITTTFTEPTQRVRAFGVFGATSASGAALGMLLGGALTEYLSWRWCMFVNVAFAVVGLIGGAIVLRHDKTTARPRFDLAGTLSSAAGVVAIVYGFARSETHGWGDAVTIGSFVAGVLLVVVFVLVERRVEHPLLPLRVILDRDRGGSLLAMAVTNVGLFGLFFFLPFYLQRTLDFSALLTGAAFVPFPLAVIVSSTYLSGLLVPRFGPRVVVGGGAILAAVGLAILQALAADTNYFTILFPALIVMGLGAGFIYTAATATSTAGIEPHDAGIASAAVNMAQQVGGSIGTALLSSIYGSTVAAYLTDRPATAETEHAASLHGYHVAFGVGAVVLLVVAVMSRLLLRGGHATAAPADDAPLLTH